MRFVFGHHFGCCRFWLLSILDPFRPIPISASNYFGLYQFRSPFRYLFRHLSISLSVYFGPYVFQPLPISVAIWVAVLGPWHVSLFWHKNTETGISVGQVWRVVCFTNAGVLFAISFRNELQKMIKMLCKGVTTFDIVGRKSIRNHSHYWMKV